MHLWEVNGSGSNVFYAWFCSIEDKKMYQNHGLDLPVQLIFHTAFAFFYWLTVLIFSLVSNISIVCCFICFSNSQPYGWNLSFTVVPTAIGTALDINLSNASLVFISVTFATMVSFLFPILRLFINFVKGLFLVICIF